MTKEEGTIGLSLGLPAWVNCTWKLSGNRKAILYSDNDMLGSTYEVAEIPAEYFNPRTH
jgi:hypothetical protein